MFVRLFMQCSFQIRQNPFRFLFKDTFLRMIGILDDDEMRVFQRRWKGPVWDVGASVGKYAAVMAKANPDQTVYCFEPNLNSLYYLGYRTANYPNVVVVPLALTHNGTLMKGSYHPDFNREPTGPRVPTLSIREAITKFGKPAFIKLDVEGEEHNLLRDEPEILRDAHLLVEWHPVNGKLVIPTLKYWKATPVKGSIVFYRPL